MVLFPSCSYFPRRIYTQKTHNNILVLDSPGIHKLTYCTCWINYPKGVRTLRERIQFINNCSDNYQHWGTNKISLPPTADSPGLMIAPSYILYNIRINLPGYIYHPVGLEGAWLSFTSLYYILRTPSPFDSNKVPEFRLNIFWYGMLKKCLSTLIKQFHHARYKTNKLITFFPFPYLFLMFFRYNCFNKFLQLFIDMKQFWGLTNQANIHTPMWKSR